MLVPLPGVNVLPPLFAWLISTPQVSLLQGNLPGASDPENSFQSVMEACTLFGRSGHPCNCTSASGIDGGASLTRL